MEIERINENTVKFFISYGDVEERGFDREEIWYNREKSEELFWEMMDEVHEAEGFVFDGPLWIQVQALEKGLEVLVTKAQIAKDGGRLELPFADGWKGIPANEKIEEYLDRNFPVNVEPEEAQSAFFIAYFSQFEDLISLSKRPLPDTMETKLFALDGKYYLYMEFPYAHFTEEDVDNIVSTVLEYGEESERTVEYLEEYGKTVIDSNVFKVIRKYFR
jgi:Negative regulator of genetic competence (MecA).